MPILRKIEKEEIPVLYTVALDRVQKVLDKAGVTGHTGETVLQFAQQGLAQLWVTINDEDLRSLFVTDIQAYPHKNVLNIWLMDGDLTDMNQDALEEVEHWAAMNFQCTAVTALVRPGLVRPLTDLGFHRTQVQVEKPIMRSLN